MKSHELFDVGFLLSNNHKNTKLKIKQKLSIQLILCQMLNELNQWKIFKNHILTRK